MVDFELQQLFPRFLLQDKNGYALAKAIESAMRYMCNRAQQGLDLILDFDAMPEWRLDELAWEYNCLYDFNGTVEEKRRWIREAAPIYNVYGTAQAIIKYLYGVFDSVEVEEASGYGGEPYHFRVTVSGELTEEKAQWAYKAIASAKNVRSVLDSMGVGSYSRIIVHGEGQEFARIHFPLCGEYLAGQWPQS